jgi:phosphodiesterase/alkaline phosphatase D-like protein
MPDRTVVRLVLVVLVLALVAAMPGSAGAVGFKYGVTAGEVTSKSAVLWGRATGRGTVTLQVARNKRFRGRSVAFYTVKSRRSVDYTVQRKVRRLKAGKSYWFRFVSGHRKSSKGTFKTAPKRSKNARIRFGWTGDTDFNPTTGQVKPYWNTGGVYRRLRAERNVFNVELGDTIYSDSEVPNRLFPIALTVKQKWAKYKVNLGNRFLRGLRGSAGYYSHLDDHEFVNDFSPQENTFDNNVNINGHTLYNRSIKAFRNYAPVGYSRSKGLYRSFRWGKNLEVFFLDERSFRSANADANHVCDNPQTHRPDLAPTAPQGTRNVFGAVFPSTGLSQPVSPACLATIRSPNRTFLGRRQLARFKAAVDRSTARWKVVMNEMPIQQFYALPYDRWEAFEAERLNLLRFLKDNVKNVVFLTTDVHATLVNDARLQTLEQGGPVNTGIYDFTVGPAATKNFATEIDEAAGQPGAGKLIGSAFFKPQPPSGVGMRCAIVDQFSYGEVSVTSSKLTITPKGIDGKPQSDCAPLVLNHR